MSDRDYSNDTPPDPEGFSEEPEFDDSLPAPIELPLRKQAIHTGVMDENGDGQIVKIPIVQPNVPAHVDHATSDEAEMDDGLSILRANIFNINQLWKTVRTIDDGKKIADTTLKLLEGRRRLANKQLGHTALKDKDAPIVIE